MNYISQGTFASMISHTNAAAPAIHIIISYHSAILSFGHVNSQTGGRGDNGSCNLCKCIKSLPPYRRSSSYIAQVGPLYIISYHIIIIMSYHITAAAILHNIIVRSHNSGSNLVAKYRSLNNSGSNVVATNNTRAHKASYAKLTTDWH